MSRYILYSMVLILTACSTAKVLHSEKAEEADLSTYKTFDFYKVEATGDTSQQFTNRIVKLEDAIAVKLQRFGYLLSKTNPDLLINIGAVVDEQVQTRQTDFRTDAPRYIGQRRYSWKSKEVEVGRYREGTVTVDLVDRKQNTLVWTGTVQGVIPQREARLDAAVISGVDKLFSKYPGRVK